MAKADYIDRKELMKEFGRYVKASNNSDFEPIPNWNDAVSLVGSAPNADVVSKKTYNKLMQKYKDLNRIVESNAPIDTGELTKAVFENDLHDIYFKESEKGRVKHFAEIKQGEWWLQKIAIRGAHGQTAGRYKCSVCGYFSHKKTEHCPKCLADMGVQNG